MYVTCICTWRLTELAIGAQRTAGEGRTVLGRPNPESETIRDYNLKPTADARNVVGPTCGSVEVVCPVALLLINVTTTRSFAPNKRHNNTRNSFLCASLKCRDRSEPVLSEAFGNV